MEAIYISMTEIGMFPLSTGSRSPSPRDIQICHPEYRHSCQLELLRGVPCATSSSMEVMNEQLLNFFSPIGKDPQQIVDRQSVYLVNALGLERFAQEATKY